MQLIARQAIEAVAPLLQQKRRGGWTHTQQMELIQQRWLADARRMPLIPNVADRTTESAWPQLAKIRRHIGDSRFEMGKRAAEADSSTRAAFISCIEQQLKQPRAINVDQQRQAAAATDREAREQMPARKIELAREEAAIKRERL